jgi:transposase
LVTAQAPAPPAIPGCGVLSAAVSIGQTAGAHRSRNKDAFARFIGTAPVPVLSGSSAAEVRLNRGGDREATYALHMIAVPQARGIGPSHGVSPQTEGARKGTAPQPYACSAAAAPTPSSPLCALIRSTPEPRFSAA